ncbi:MAG: hypothetical protein MJ252_10555, partial [archaeon]|nr:hypothetical protein [archaeon]
NNNYNNNNITKDIPMIVENIEKLSKIYVEEFKYTPYHVSEIISNDFKVLFYRNIPSVTDLSLFQRKIDFGLCYKKIQDYYNITEELVISLININTNTNINLNTNKNVIETKSYLFFNPVTGEMIDPKDICKDDTIYIEENILQFLDEETKENLETFISQNINIFNQSDHFYTDICFYFTYCI